MKRSFKTLFALLMLAGLSGCGVFKKSCNCPKVSSVNPEPRIDAVEGSPLASLLPG